MRNLSDFSHSRPVRLTLTFILLAGVLFTGSGLGNSLATTGAPAPAAAAAAASAPALVLAPQGGLTCVTYQPSATSGKDAYIKEDKKDERRGGDSELRVKTETGKLNRALLQFDLAGLPPGALISSATLSLWVKEVRDGNATITARQVTSSWNEAEVTWNARDKAANQLWTTAGGDYSATALSTHNVVKDVKNYGATWNVTAAAVSWAASPATNYGVLLESPVTTPKNETKFKSSDDGTAAQRPKLEVCYNAGVTLEPDNNAEGAPGFTRTYAHVVRVGGLTTAVNLSATSSQGWPVRIYKDINGNGVKDPEDTQITSTPTIGPNADYPIVVQVDVPANVQSGAQDTTTVTATAVSASASATAVDVTRVGRLISVTPSYDVYRTAGSVVFYGHTVTNNGDALECLDISALSGLGWTVYLWEDLNGNGVHETVSPNEPPVTNPVCLDPGQSYKLVAEVRVPAGAGEGEVDQTTITAASSANSDQTGVATDITRVFVNAPPVIDGKYDDIYSQSPDATQVCYSANGVLFGKLATFYQPSGDSVYMVLAIDKDFVDNTYGANAIGWSGGHSFGNLTGSDHAQFLGYDVNGNLVLDIKQDYLTSSAIAPSTPSGYDSLGVTGGEGDVNLGSAANITAWATSLDFNLNSTGYCAGGLCNSLGTDLETVSPATDSFYTPNPTYPDWIYDVIYEIKIAKTAFGAAGFGSLDVPYIHASPSKIGTNTIIAEPGVCPGEIGDTVWYDANHDGVQDPGEAGIANVQVKLYQDNGDGVLNAATDLLIGTTVTNTNGRYLFQNLAPNDYFVDVVDSTVPAGYVSTTFNDPTPIINLGEGVSYLEADFGYIAAYPELEITKTYTGPPTVRVGEIVTFKIEVANTGFTTINVLPLLDWYDTTMLDFISATPAANDSIDDGVLNWSDLTAAGPNGFGRDLARGDSFQVTLQFRAVQATTAGVLAAGADATSRVEMASTDGLPANLLAAPEALTAASAVPETLNAVAAPGAPDATIGGVNLGNLTDYLFFFANGSTDANWQGASKGFVGNVAVDGVQAKERTSGGVPYAGTIYTNDSTLGAWQGIVNQNAGQAFASTGQGARISGLEADLNNAFVQINGLAATPGYTSIASTSLNGFNSQNGIAQTFVINITSGLQVSSQINFTGDSTDVFILRWDSDGNPNNGYQGETKFQSGGAIIPLGGLKASNFINVAGDINASGGGSTPTANNYPQGPRFSDGQGALCSGCANFSGGGFFTGYWLTTGDPTKGETSSLSNAIFVGGWYSTTTKFSMTSGTSGVYVSPPQTESLGSIGDRVFYDLNQDGLPDDDGDPGLTGVRVNLYKGDCLQRGDFVSTLLTGANGAYSFTSLPAGTYCVDVDGSTLPLGVTLTTGNEPLTVSLASGQNFTDADFGYVSLCPDGTPDRAAVKGATDTAGNQLPTVSDDACAAIQPAFVGIGDKVWNDSNADGIQDPGEVGIPGVVVELFDGDGNGIGMTTTNAEGIYEFTNLPAGTYYLQFSPPDGYEFTVQDVGSDDARDSDTDSSGLTAPFSLVGGQSDPTRDAGLYMVVKIGDHVWRDTNGNGIQDPGEPGVGNVKVSLFHTSGALVAEELTNGNGDYLFGDLAPGNYCLQFTAPAGTVFTLPNQGNDAFDSDADPATGRTECTNLVAGETDLTWDAGLVLPGAIGDFVWYDSNGDGIQNVGEPGIANVTLNLSLNGGVIATTTTDADGGYLFPDLAPGTYTVDVTDSYGKLTGLTHIVANQSLADPTVVVLGASEVNKDIDFGYVRQPNAGAAIIGDTVWYDGNGDGLQQPGEPGIPGIQVCAVSTSGGPTNCATTDSNGHYLIETPAGSYNVAPTNPPGGYTATTPAPHPVTVVAGEQYLAADFGYKAPPTAPLGAIGNLVFLDANSPQGNGVFDAGDTPLPGVSVDLIRDANGNKAWDPGEPIIATVTSGSALLPANGANGNYLFTGLPAGNYLVHVSDTNAVLTDYSKSQLGAAGVDNNNQADPYAVPLGAGSTVLTADFGYERGGGTEIGGPDGVIGNQVWIESDGNGLFDPINGDFGQPGVTLDLFRQGQPIDTTTTGASGRYAFLHLPAGNYTVKVTDLAGVLTSYETTILGPNPTQDNNNQAQPYAITLPEGGYNPTADFGYIQPGAIGDYVWYDTNDNGIQDVGEPGIGNVTLRLYRDTNGNNTLDLATDKFVGGDTTGADGGYLFADLEPGVYFVDVTDDRGMLTNLSHTSGPQSQPDPTGPILLGPAAIYRDADFGYVKRPGSGNAIIGDTVWYDGDGDGVRDPGEPGIGGVQVCATPVGGGGAICDITNSAGIYQIEVPAGTYTVAPTDPPAGYTATTPAPHGPITVGPGDQYLDADFGYTSPNLGSISGTVWHDTGANGVLEAGEPRLPGVSVDLIADLNGNKLWDAGEPVIATTTSDTNGNYIFDGLPAGDYLVIVSDTQHVLDDFAAADLGPDPGADNNNQTQPYPVKLASGEDNPTADFGYLLDGTTGLLGIIGNQVWYEEDGNGLYNPQTGDTGVAGVTVTLYRGGASYATTTTGASGDYVFTSLPSGNYTVRVTDAFGILSSYILTVLGPNPGQDDNHQAQPYAVSLPPAGMNMTADFGYTRPGAIGDFVWYDASRDGVQDVGEPGIANVTLDLYRNGVKVASTITDADGGYLFGSLPPGTYVVDVTDLYGKLANLTHLVANQSVSDPTANISLDAGTAYKDADFGYVRIPNVGKAIIGDTVWYDANADGIQQPGELGIPGVQVCATPTAGGGAVCQTTDSNGRYRLEVNAGSYNVAPTNPPAGYTATTPASQAVTVTAGQQYLDADFGYDAASLGTVGDLVFLDANRNGVFDAGDAPLPGVSVDLIRDNSNIGTWDAGEPIVATVTTGSALDANGGNYLFTAVPAGNYLVHVSDTNSVLLDYVKSPLGPNPGVNNNNQVDPYPVSPISANNLSADFGYYKSGRPDSGVIGNQVWIEIDNDGLFEPAAADVGQAGVTVVLSKNGEVVATTTTGASGDYSFVGLPAGNYTVKVTDDFGVLLGHAVTALGPNPGQDNNNQQQPYGVSLPTAGYNLTADFGYLKLAGSIGDTVFFDDNRNGAQDPSEVGIPGIVVKLYRDGAGVCDVLVGSQTTNTSGRYLFIGLAPGHYCVQVPETPADNPFLTRLTRTAGANPQEVNLALDQDYLDADFGYAGLGEIRGVVYYDFNEDRVRGIGEPGIPNVEVCLYADANGSGVGDPNELVGCQNTNPDGGYAFTDLLPGAYVLTEKDPNGVISTTSNLLTTVLVVTQGIGISADNDFGDTVVSDYTITKTLKSPEPARPGQPVSFEIKITNTGNTTIATLPLQDVYDKTYLRYLNANPASLDNIDDGTIDWFDLTISFGRDLAPGDSFSVWVYFIALKDTTGLPSNRTINTAYVINALADPDGPSGALGAILPLGNKNANASVPVINPTGVTLERFEATAQPEGVLVSWATATEHAIFGFNVLRDDGTGTWVPVNGDLIIAENSGADRGAEYRLTDATAAPGATYRYVLEVLRLDGSFERFGPVEVTIP